jgi:hypothetical protein
MDRATAERLMSILLRLDGPLNEATELTDEIADPDERKAFLRQLADIGGSVYMNLMRPIVRQYPDLDPVERPTVSGSP